MYDPAPERGPLTPRELTISALFLAILLGLFTASIFYEYSPIKLSALLVILFWIPLLVVHEAGHAIVAHALGWYVRQVVLGMGRTLARFRIGRARVEVRLLPIEGFVASVPTDLHWPRVKSAAIYFAGPAADLLTAAAVLLIIGPDRLLSPSEEYGLIVWQSLALAAVSQGVLNLIPHSVRTPAREIANDGLGIIRSFLLPESHYADMIGQTYDEQGRCWSSSDPADWWQRN
jgi:hypothetical protein